MRIRTIYPPLFFQEEVLPDVWTGIAYQGFTSNNWEIHTLSDIQLEKNITDHFASDVHPHLNVGAFNVVFASNRSGNFEIYKMNVNGTGLTQLTDNRVDDLYPVWSPDGEEIAYQTEIDGQTEIFVMRADGAGKRQITNNPGADRMPFWSPNGSQIAFSSEVDGEISIYSAFSNGSGVRQLSSQAESLYPIWSPDGKKIAYSADGDGDGWLELWAMNADGSGQQQVYHRPTTNDIVANSWSPDSGRILYSDNTYTLFSGLYLLATVQLRFIDLESDEISAFRLLGRDHQFGSWESRDRVAPVSAFYQLPAYTQGVSVTLNLTGTDDLAELLHYDVRYRREGESRWTDLATYTTTTPLIYRGSIGEQLYFQIRATDEAENNEAWSETADGVTLLYNTAFLGTLRDNRGVPLSGVPLEISPPPLSPTLTADDGSFFALLPDELPRTLSISRAEYGTWPAVVISPTSGISYDLYLPPDDDQLVNGSFEVELNQPGGGWFVLPDPSGVERVEAPYSVSGQYGLKIDVEQEPNAALWQPVTIPEGEAQGTLAFMARAGSVLTESEPVQLVMTISDTVSTTDVYSAEQGSEVGLHWVDLSPWAGETITVGFGVSPTAAAPNRQLILDDISLGSTATELFAEVIGPDDLSLNETALLTITVGNVGSIAAEQITLTLELSETFSIVDSSITPTNVFSDTLRWQIPSLSSGAEQRITVTLGTWPGRPADYATTVEVRTETQERELENNVNRHVINYRPVMLLPFVGRE